MSALSKFMHTARAVLDEQARKDNPGKDRPPFFLRTTWLFAELEELAIPADNDTTVKIKFARHIQSIAALPPLLDQIEANTATITDDSRKRHERNQLCLWIREQIAKESGNGN